MKLCIDCKYASGLGCTHPRAATQNFIDGSYTYERLIVMRNNIQKCGPTASLYKELPWIFKLLRRIFYKLD